AGEEHGVDRFNRRARGVAMAGGCAQAKSASRAGKTRPGSGHPALGWREMSLEKYRRALELITKAGGGGFVGARPAAMVARAEAALGLRFPPSYRQFLLELGAGDVGGFEVYGVVNDNFTDARVPDAIALTLQARGSGLDRRYVMIGTLGDG